MSNGLVLVIEDDEWVSRLLAGAIRDAGYDVTVHGTAQTGLEAACSLQPDCIICDIDLPDHDGYWVARNVRTQSSRVSVTPFLFLSGLDDQASRLEGFHVGADVYMTKPFRVDEVVAQVGALVQMATRLRQRRDSYRTSPPPGAEATAIEGDLSQMSIATVLTVLEMERRTGIFEIASKRRRARLEIASGLVISGTVGDSPVSALDAVRAMLAWREGRFSFSPLPPREAPEGQQSIGAFLLEAVRLEDESARNEHELAMMRGAKAATKIPAPGLRGSPLKDVAIAASQAISDAPPQGPVSDPPTSAMPISVEPEEPSDEHPAPPLPKGHAGARPPALPKLAPPKPPTFQKPLLATPAAQQRPGPPPKPPAAGRPPAPAAPPPGPPPRKVSVARTEPIEDPAAPPRSPDDSGARPIPPPPRLPPRPAPNQPPEAGGKKR